MSALIEYLKLIPKGIENASLILDGIVNRVKLNFGHLPSDEKEEIIRRMVICKSCPFMSANAVNDPSLNYKTDRADEHCSLCQCNIDLKTSSLDSNCGIEVYNKTVGIAMPLELKWTNYKKPTENGVQ